MKEKISSSPIFSIVSRILFAPIIIFGLYVQFHGDYGPGGGFQAGVIIAACIHFILNDFWIKKW
jgi:multicomponent Na+:H+ antiporter subunit B